MKLILSLLLAIVSTVTAATVITLGNDSGTDTLQFLFNDQSLIETLDSVYISAGYFNSNTSLSGLTGLSNADYANYFTSEASDYEELASFQITDKSNFFGEWMSGYYDDLVIQSLDTDPAGGKIMYFSIFTGDEAFIYQFDDVITDQGITPVQRFVIGANPGTIIVGNQLPGIAPIYKSDGTLLKNNDGLQLALVSPSSVVPEPSSLLLIGLGSLALVARRNRKS